ncbi:FAD-dependent oxidoreductase [Fictibacillus terranigra]|uniref:FAD-dependent oxidoreductase n=1 Tax=Fictibacillus terranigra TaxID=3058424 RepID=A0ABT8E5I6_9BACL|nr:FAD-dependent oxidoreductase [Fictibacillus sp. CENA-BCM004]MDN4073178.1 FAD-dependent oxidoreductase [Fictibacillus sp. CENA-BCM004]
MKKSKLPDFSESYWRDSCQIPEYEALTSDLEAEAVVIGGGITGITTAYLLAKEGVKAVLIDGGKLLNGTTGHTTAKITCQHGVIYDELIQHFGIEQTKLYYEANHDGLKFIRSMIEDHQIDCDFSEEDAIIYAESESYLNQVQKEYEAYQKLNIKSEYSDRIALDLAVHGAVAMKNQAQFHPVKYLTALVQEITKNGGKIFEGTTAVDIEANNQLRVVTREGHKISCKYAVVASHFPFYDGAGFYFARMHPERSYAIGVKAVHPYPGGMYLSADSPTRSLRYTDDNGEKLIIVGGESHQTGQDFCTSKHYEALHDFSEKVIGISEIPYRWSAQDLITLDKIPYVGKISENRENILVATGYRKWGMTNGTAAALILRDIILEKRNLYADVFTPSRFKADPSLKTLVRENADVAKHLIEGKLEMPDKTPADLGPDEGAAVTFNGKRAGAYKDPEGKLYVLDTTCTHMGCEVEWNNAERSWDCPCHGSRFSYKGEVVEGPAKDPLEKLDQ